MKDEIIVFRPSSMPITEVIEEDKEFDEAKITYFLNECFISRTKIKVKNSQMDNVLLDYATKVICTFSDFNGQTISYEYEKKEKLSAFDIRVRG